MVMWTFSEGLGWAGAALIGVIAMFIEPWQPIERAALFVSSLLTVLGTMVTAGSIFFPPDKIRKPSPHSHSIVAPIVLFACAVACRPVAPAPRQNQ